MTRSAYQKMNLGSDGWFIDAEIMIQARRMRFKIDEVETVFHSIDSRPSFVKPLSILEFLANLWFGVAQKLGSRIYILYGVWHREYLGATNQVSRATRHAERNENVDVAAFLTLSSLAFLPFLHISCNTSAQCEFSQAGQKKKTPARF